MIKINDLSFAFNQKTVLENIDLNIDESSIVALAGLNGAGKTTLIKLILDQLRTGNSESILINGKSNWAVESRQDVIYLPEVFRLKGGDTPLDYLKFLAGVYKKELSSQRLESLCQTLDFPIGMLKKDSRKLSKGSLQKVGIMGCFLFDIPCLILDEPLSGLDPKARHQVKKLFQDDNKSNRTVLFSTHLLSDIDEICTHVIILHDGKVRFIGSPEKLRIDNGSENLEQAFLRML